MNKKEMKQTIVAFATLFAALIILKIFAVGMFPTAVIGGLVTFLCYQVTEKVFKCEEGTED